jgi:carbon monoxide dehydrogenase subunit G
VYRMPTSSADRHPGVSTSPGGTSGPVLSPTLIRLRAVTQVDRDPDWVFRRLHDLEMILSCVPGGNLTRRIDSRTFEARILISVGPFKFGFAGKGRIVASDPRSRTAAISLRANPVTNVPTVRIRMAMAIGDSPRGSEIQMSFRVAVWDRRGLITQGLVKPIAYDLFDQTIRTLRQRLQVAPLPPAA